MRKLSLLVAAETLALVVLASLWALRGDVAAGPGAAPSDDGPRGAESATPRIAAGADRADRGVELTPGARDRVASITDRCILLGRVLVPPGDAIPDRLQIVLRRDGGYRNGFVANGQYAVADLTPGDWLLEWSATEYRSGREAIAIPSAAIAVHDVELVRAQSVPVRLRTPDGRSLLEALHCADHTNPFAVAAFEAPLAHDLPTTELGQMREVGCGRWIDPRQDGSSVEPDDADGTLLLDVPAPVHAALLFRHLLVAQQPVAAGQDSLVFTVDPAAIEARCGSLRMRLIDGVTGAPVTDAWVDVSSASSSGERMREADGEGRVLVTKIPPGLARVTVGSGQREMLQFVVEIPAGNPIELGELALLPALEFEGRLLDAGGAGVAGRVEWTALDRPRARGTTADWRNAATGEDGRFTIRAAAGRYLLTASCPDRRAAHAIVDLRAGTSTPIDLLVAPATRVRVTASGDPLRGYALEFFDAAGRLAAARRIDARRRERMLHLLPGRYVLEIHDESDAWLARRELEVGAEEIRVEIPR